MNKNTLLSFHVFIYIVEKKLLFLQENNKSIYFVKVR